MKTVLLVLALALCAAGTVGATPVTGINVTTHDGQTFVTWNNLVATGVKYYIYRSLSPIITTADLTGATQLGYVLDSSGDNTRYTFNGTGKHYVVDAAGTTLASGKGLFVTTITVTGPVTAYYAVTNQQPAQLEDKTITAGDSWTSGISESMAPVVPVLQDKFKNSHQDSVYVYVQFLTRTSTAGFPQFTNAGSFPINFALVKSHTSTGPAHPLVVKLHAGGGSFNDAIDGSLQPNVWRISLDDWIPAASYSNTAWFGYHENFDILSDTHTLPVTGTVRTYTSRRVAYTVDWVIATFTASLIDTTRIYLVGESAGAAGSAMLCMLYPAKFAAAQLGVPKFDVSYTTDPNPNANHNPGNPGRVKADTMFGPVASTNLITDIPDPNNPGQFLHMYDFGNLGHMANVHYNRGIPLIFAANGKRDTTVGWGEKIGYYDSIEANRQGGAYYWDMRTHSGAGKSWTEWQPDLLRYATTISFPAFSKCTIDDDPGNGAAGNGDSVGCLNGFLDWDDNITDTGTLWSTTLTYRTGMLRDGNPAVPSATKCHANVTLRRVQSFIPANGDVITWNAYYNNQVIKTKTFTYHNGPVTLFSVPIRSDGVLLEVILTPAPHKTVVRAGSSSQGARLDLR